MYSRVVVVVVVCRAALACCAFSRFATAKKSKVEAKATMVEDGGGTAGVTVLLHTVPHSAADIDAEEAVWRQYNSCVDFTFQESRGNAREFFYPKEFKPESRAGMAVDWNE